MRAQASPLLPVTDAMRVEQIGFSDVSTAALTGAILIIINTLHSRHNLDTFYSMIGTLQCLSPPLPRLTNQ